MTDYALEDTVYIPFTTRAFATGIPTALVSGQVDIYEDATATPIVTSETFVASLNSVTGFNMITVTATAATGFNVGGHYTAVLAAGTVDSVSVVGEVVGEFTIGHSAAAQDLANGTDGLGAIKADTAAVLADTGTDGVVVAAASKTGYSLTATTGLGDQTANITGNLSGSVGSVTGAVGSVTGAVGSVTGAVGSVSGNVDGNVSGNVANVLAISGVAVTADRLEAWLNGFLTATVEEGAGPTTTVFQTDATEVTDNHFKNSIVVFTGGALLGQARRVASYTGATGTFTVEPALTEAPAAGDTIVNFPFVIGGIDDDGRMNVGRWLDTAVTTSATSAKPEVDMFSVSDDATAANNVELDYDGTGYAKANSTIGTCTTNTDMRGTDSAALASVATEARLAELDAGNLPTDVAAVKTDTAAILLDTGTDGVVVAAASKTGYSLTATTGLGNQTANITGNLSGTIGGLTAGALADLFDTDSGTTYGAAVAGSVVKEIADNAGGGTPPTAAAIADAVWDEAQADHVGAGTFGEIATEIASILVDTNELQTDNVPGLIAALNDVAATDIVSGGAITTSGGAVSNVTLVATTTTNTDMLTAAAVNAEVVDALNVDTYAEPGQGAPGATISLAAKIGYIYKFLRNRVTSNATTINVYNDDATTVDHKSTHSDNGVTYDRGEFATGP